MIRSIGFDEMKNPVFWRDVIAEVFCSSLLLFSLTCNYVEFGRDFMVTPTHVGLVMGLTVVALVETFGHIGGAFMNPAVTFTMMCRRELSPMRGLCVLIVFSVISAYMGEQHFAHKNTKMQFLENKYAVWLHKSYPNGKRFLKL